MKLADTIRIQLARVEDFDHLEYLQIRREQLSSLAVAAYNAKKAEAERDRARALLKKCQYQHDMKGVKRCVSCRRTFGQPCWDNCAIKAELGAKEAGR